MTTVEDLRKAKVTSALYEDMVMMEYLTVLENAVSSFYWQLFSLGAGGKMHTMVEWCGVMQEWLAMHKFILQSGCDATQSSIHSTGGDKLPEFQLEYMAEKLNCIFSGMLVVTVAKHDRT